MPADPQPKAFHSVATGRVPTKQPAMIFAAAALEILPFC